MPSPARPTLLFFAHERGDARVRKRLQAFIDQGWRVIGLTFHRHRAGKDPGIFWENIHLGTTYDRRYLQRLLAIFGGLAKLWKNRALFAEATALYAINADNGWLALLGRWMAGKTTPLAVEIADIQPPMIGAGARAKAMRFFEAAVLQRTRWLITTSPGFLRHYFEPFQPFKGPVFLLENRVYPSPAVVAVRDRTPEVPPPHDAPWVVGYFGALRCERSWEAIRWLGRELNGRVRFVLRGYPTALSAEKFAHELADSPNVEFAGRYAYPDDLPTLYGAIHFSWCFDFSDAGANSRWLLPNRIYEGGLFHVPALADADTETGRWVAQRGAGWTFHTDDHWLESMADFFRKVSPTEWSTVRARLKAEPDEAFTGEADYRRLSELLQTAPETHSDR